ncbi:MAG TPA: MarR family transcriptional regulator [Bacteroidales bacterium]
MEFKLENSINHRIATLAGLLKRQVFRIIAENNLDITPDQWVVMYYLWQENGLSVGELANRTQKDFANVTRIVDKLEKMGYVNKTKNSVDSRGTNIFILPKADEIKEKIQNCQRESSSIALKGVSDTEQQNLLKIIEKIEGNILANLK